MACYFCKQEGHPSIPDIGPCDECNKFVCTDPSGRNDGMYHAEQCSCYECTSIVCVHEMLRHATGHSSRIENCFPKLSLVHGIVATRESAAMLNETRTTFDAMISQVHALSFFLTKITPGIEALNNRTSLFMLDRNNTSVSLDFFSPRQRRMKINYLAQDMISKTWRKIAHNFKDSFLMRSSEGWRLDRISDSFRNQPRIKVDLPFEVREQFEETLRAIMIYPPPLYPDRDTPISTIPLDQNEIVDWLMEE